MHSCPACGGECKRHSVAVRKVKDICLDGPLTLQVSVGNYRCASCQRFFRPQLPFVGRANRYSTRAIRKATVSVQEDKGTYTNLPHRLSRDFSIKPAKSTGWLWFQEHAATIDPTDYFRWACGQFSGQLSVDSVKDKDHHVWFATDPLNRDLILGYLRCEHADAESLTKFLTGLRDGYGIRPLLFTHDDAAVFNTAPQSVWPEVRMQLCHFHAIKALVYSHLRHSLKKLLNKWKPAKPVRLGRGLESYKLLKAEYAEELKVWTKLFRKRRLFFRNPKNLLSPESIERGEGQFIDAACAVRPALARFRSFIVDFYGIMDSKDAAAAELLRQAFIAKWSAEDAGSDEHMKYVLKRFGDDAWFGRLFAFTAFENGQRTTNSTERANRWFRKRQKSHYRIRKEHTIAAMLNADLAYRRCRLVPTDPPNRLRPKPVQLNQSA